LWEKGREGALRVPVRVGSAIDDQNPIWMIFLLVFTIAEEKPIKKKRDKSEESSPPRSIKNHNDAVLRFLLFLASSSPRIPTLLKACRPGANGR
jgi:hypothetical protein